MKRKGQKDIVFGLFWGGYFLSIIGGIVLMVITSLWFILLPVATTLLVLNMLFRASFGAVTTYDADPPTSTS
jgi:hypothetical protein